MKAFLKSGITLLLAATLATPAFAGGGHGGGGHGGYYGGHGGGGWGWFAGAAILGSAAYLASNPYRYGYGYSYPYTYVAPAPIYVEPAYVQPQIVDVQPQQVVTAPSSDWYYCRRSKAYYPYVRSCAAGWERVPTTPSAP